MSNLGVRDREPSLRVRGIRRRFDGIQALDGLSLELGVAEWIGLLGPNGAGKTTLMHAIAGLVKVDEGSFELLGEATDPTRSRRARRLLGLVPQEVALYPQLTARENLETFGILHGVDQVDLPGRIGWALDWTGVGTRAREPVDRLSGGMRRRLNIACAVLHEPRVVLLDEPTVGVDPQGRERIWEMLQELRSKGASLIHSSHQLHEIESTCDRVLIMDRGRILAEGRLDQLIAGASSLERSLRVRFSEPPTRLQLASHFRVQGTSIHGGVRDLAEELPWLLQASRDAGLEVLDIHLEAPSLEDVFTHVTGRELRD
jgi:ABC-2 type transport system ATP-binding protein